MKKLFLIAVYAALTPPTTEIVVKHHDYISYYNPILKEADSVSWNLNASMVSCADQDRKDAFKQDPQIPGSAKPDDYAVNSSDPKSPKYNKDRAAWIDEGHLYSYQSAMCSVFGKVECFYMTNMLPQYHAFNAGDWKTLEVQERIWAKTMQLHIIAGGFGTLGTLPAGENIPRYTWKAILMNGKYSVWIMPNSEHSVGDKGLKTNKYNAWLSPVLHKFDLASIGAEIKRLKI